VLAPQLVSLTLVPTVLIGVLVLGLVGVVTLVAVSRHWLRREDARSGVSGAAHGAAGTPGAVGTVPTLVSAHAAVDLADAVAAEVQRDPTGVLLVVRAEDVLPSERQLQEAARVLDLPDTGFVTFTDDDTPETRVRRDRRLDLAAPGPVAVRAEAVADVGGWDGDAVLPETELSARMLRRGWYGGSLGAVPDSTCDARARERQVAWAVVRRHPGLLVPGPRHAGNELSARERLVLLATTAAALTAAPTPAERAWALDRARSLRPRARGLRLPGVIPAVGIALTVVAAAALVAVVGASPTPPVPGAASAARGSAEPVSSGATYLLGQHLQARTVAVAVPTRAGASRTAGHRRAARHHAARHHGARHQAARHHAVERATPRRPARTHAVRRPAARPARTVVHRPRVTRARVPASVATRAPVVRQTVTPPARPAKVHPAPTRPAHSGGHAGRPPRKAQPAEPVKATEPGKADRPSKRRP